MHFSLYASKGLVFPGRAGQLQTTGAASDLAAELGDNYPRYHAFLERELAVLGRPRRGQYPDFDSYSAAYAKAQTIVLAETFLRNCVAFRRAGTPLDSPLDHRVPLLDKTDRLVSLPT